MPRVHNREQLVQRARELRAATPRPSIEKIADTIGMSRTFVIQALRETPDREAAAPAPAAADDSADATGPEDVELHDEGEPKRKRTPKRPDKKPDDDPPAGAPDADDDGPEDPPAGGERVVELRFF